jgi:hypothetical protein
VEDEHPKFDNLEKPTDAYDAAELTPTISPNTDVAIQVEFTYHLRLQKIVEKPSVFVKVPVSKNKLSHIK